MIIGVPKEIKAQEHRVGLVPSTASTLTRRGHAVLVQKSAGVGAGFPDETYTAVGAKVIDTAEDLFKQA
jgi:alanine dehydrogenase